VLIHPQLKKDYIPGYGDTVDLVIVAASWDKNRARELRGGHLIFFSSSPDVHTLYSGAYGLYYILRWCFG
jgi:hypothetical protein